MILLNKGEGRGYNIEIEESLERMKTAFLVHHFETWEGKDLECNKWGPRSDVTKTNVILDN